MNEERALVVPTKAVTFGARALDVPGRGRVLCASCAMAFQIEDGAPMAPAKWYEALARHAGEMAVADTLAPLPGAEVLILGPVGTSAGQGGREARITLEPDLDLRLTLRGDGPARAGWEDAVRHAADNPGGRQDGAQIVRRDGADNPVWLGATPIDHPMRMREAGNFQARGAKPGWPDDASPWVLGEAHPALRVERIDPGAVLRLEGLTEGEAHIEVAVPPWRVAMTSAWKNETFRAESARIHTLCVIPSAGVAAAVWRTAIALERNDAFGADVTALIVGVEHGLEAPNDTDHWAQLAMQRWVNPELALDERPLLHASLAQTIAPPFEAPGDDDPSRARHRAADAWARKQTGAPKENPFAKGGEAAGAGALASAQAADAASEAPPSGDAMSEAAQAALALGRERHREAGFDPETRAPPETVKTRGGALDAEIEERLQAPHRSESEIQLAQSMAAAGEEEARRALARLSAVRLISPMPVLGWAGMPDDEAQRFGEAFIASLARRPAFAYLDVSGARIGGAHARGQDAVALNHESFERLLAENTRFEEAEFTDCDFTDASLCGAEFQHCVFTRCTFVRTNLNRTAFARCRFVDTNWCDLRMTGPTWGGSSFEGCEWSGVQASDVAASDLSFEGGRFDDVQICDALWIRVVMRAMRWKSVALLDTHAPECTLEDIEMTQVWITTKGFSASRIANVRADTCGFLSMARFDHSAIERSRFKRCGFNRAVMNETRIDARSRFIECDFGNTVWRKARIDGARFAQCTFADSVWEEVSAIDSWFLACAMTGVDLDDVDLTRAVFTDSDLEIVRMRPEHTAGADFAGTVRAEQ